MNNLPFDATYGYTLDSLLRVDAPPEPPDFEAFWRDTFEQSRRIPLNLAHRQVPSPQPGVNLYEVEFDSLGGARIGAWVTASANVPAGAIGRGVVVGHGYGGREQPEWQLPGPAAVAIFPCARGFHRSATPEIPNNSARHVLHGIASRDTYSHRGSAADLWGAASVLLELYPHVAGNLDYMGGSFGGGMGALMLPWDQRFRRGFLDVPSHGNYPLRIKFACEGSGDAVQHYFWEHPEVMDVLKYHDATLAAKHIRIPMLVAPALLDPKVPPPGQFSVYNAIPGDKQLFVRQWGHVDWPTDDGVRLTAALNTFFS